MNEIASASGMATATDNKKPERMIVTVEDACSASIGARSTISTKMRLGFGNMISETPNKTTADSQPANSTARARSGPTASKNWRLRKKDAPPGDL